MLQLQVASITGLKPIEGFEDGERFFQLTSGEDVRHTSNFVSSGNDILLENDFQFFPPFEKYVDFRLRNSKELSKRLKAANVTDPAKKVCARINISKMQQSWEEMCSTTSASDRPQAWSIRVPLNNKQGDAGEAPALTLIMSFCEVTRGSGQMLQHASSEPGVDKLGMDHGGPRWSQGSSLPHASSEPGGPPVLRRRSSMMPGPKSILRSSAASMSSLESSRRTSSVRFQRASFMPTPTAHAGKARPQLRDSDDFDDVTYEVAVDVKQYKVKSKIKMRRLPSQ